MPSFRTDFRFDAIVNGNHASFCTPNTVRQTSTGTSIQRTRPPNGKWQTKQMKSGKSMNANDSVRTNEFRQASIARSLVYTSCLRLTAKATKDPWLLKIALNFCTTAGNSSTCIFYNLTYGDKQPTTGTWYTFERN